MTLDEYIEKKTTELKQLIASPSLINQYGQIFAKKMGAEFNQTYDETSLWRMAQFLSLVGTRVLRHGDKETGEFSLKLAAEIYETLSIMSDRYDRDFAKILAALSYDISGYSANAKCLVQGTYELEINSEWDHLLNYLLSGIGRLIVGRLQDEPEWDPANDASPRINELQSAIRSSIKHFTQFQLYGESSDFVEELRQVRLQKAPDTTLYLLLSLLQEKFRQSEERTTWKILKPYIDVLPDVWRPYLRLISINPYRDGGFLSLEYRVSQAELWKSQINAVNAGLLNENRGFVIQMPTSAGKTLIAEMAILQQIGKGKKCLYVAPFRALVNEVEQTLTSHLSRLGYLVSSLSGAYEMDESDQFWVRQSDVLVVTPEKLDFLLRVRSDQFSDVGMVVVDEGHVLGNLDERSAELELLTAKLKHVFYPRGARFLFISAVVPTPDASSFARWLMEDERAVVRSPELLDRSVWQPTRRLVGRFRWISENGQVEFNNYVQNTSLRTIFIPRFLRPIVSSSRSFPDRTNKSQTAAMLAYRYIAEGSVLVFSATVGRRGGGGVYSILNAFDLLFQHLSAMGQGDEFPTIRDSESVEAAERWYGPNHLITRCLRRGVAPHFGELAEEVRRAVERDYVDKRIKILVATNTLGQGVNLPIKTIIVYSVDINPDPNNRSSIQVRDFWNIVGRAGRAGRETEGQIVFITNSKRDQRNYARYSNPNNVERVRSIFAVAVELFRERRLSGSQFEQIVGDLIEPSLLSYLVEEVVDTPDQQLIESFLGGSLFKVQALEQDFDLMTDVVLRRANDIWQVEGLDRKAVYAKTGLSIESCKHIEQVLRQVDGLSSAVYGSDVVRYLQVGFHCLSQCKEMQPNRSLESIAVFTNPRIQDFLQAWTSGKTLDQLRSTWEQAAPNSADGMITFVEDMLSYRLPWGMTAVLFIAAFVLGVDWETFPRGIRIASSCIKYGLSNEEELWLRGVGISSRDACMLIARNYLSQKETYPSDLGPWFVGQTASDFEAMGIESRYVMRNILQVSEKLSFSGSNNHRIQDRFSCVVKGIRYAESRIRIARAINVGDQLLLRRQPDNPFDTFAIELLFNNEVLGFLPRDLAKNLSFQIDVMQRHFESVVIEKRGLHVEVEIYAG